MFTCYRLFFYVSKYAIWFENIMLIVVVIFSTQQFFLLSCCNDTALPELSYSSMAFKYPTISLIFLISCFSLKSFYPFTTQHQTNQPANKMITLLLPPFYRKSIFFENIT